MIVTVVFSMLVCCLISPTMGVYEKLDKFDCSEFFDLLRGCLKILRLQLVTVIM